MITSAFKAIDQEIIAIAKQKVIIPDHFKAIDREFIIINATT